MDIQTIITNLNKIEIIDKQILIYLQLIMNNLDHKSNELNFYLTKSSNKESSLNNDDNSHKNQKREIQNIFNFKQKNQICNLIKTLQKFVCMKYFNESKQKNQKETKKENANLQKNHNEFSSSVSSVEIPTKFYENCVTLILIISLKLSKIDINFSEIILENFLEHLDQHENCLINFIFFYRCYLFCNNLKKICKKNEFSNYLFDFYRKYYSQSKKFEIENFANKKNLNLNSNHIHSQSIENLISQKNRNLKNEKIEKNKKDNLDENINLQENKNSSDYFLEAFLKRKEKNTKKKSEAHSGSDSIKEINKSAKIKSENKSENKNKKFHTKIIPKLNLNIEAISLNQNKKEKNFINTSHLEMEYPGIKTLTNSPNSRINTTTNNRKSSYQVYRNFITNNNNNNKNHNHNHNLSLTNMNSKSSESKFHKENKDKDKDIDFNLSIKSKKDFSVKSKIPELKFPLNKYEQYQSLSRSSQRNDFLKSTGTSSGGNKKNRKYFLNNFNKKEKENSQMDPKSISSKRNTNTNINKIPISGKSKNMNESIRNLKTLAKRLGESCLANDLAALINQKRDMELQKLSKDKNSKNSENEKVKSFGKNEFKLNIKLKENEKENSLGKNDANKIAEKYENDKEENNFYNSERNKLISNRGKNENEIILNEANKNKNLDYLQKLKYNKDIDSDEEFYDELITNIKNNNNPEKNSFSFKNILNKQIRFKNSYNEDKEIKNPSNLNGNQNEISELKKNFIFSFENPNMDINNINNNVIQENESNKNLYKLREMLSNLLLLSLNDYSIEELSNKNIDINLLYLILQLPSLQSMRYKSENKVINNLINFL